MNQHIYYILFISIFMFASCEHDHSSPQNPIINLDSMMVRIAEIKIDPESLDEYLNILKEEARKSIELEEGVISIFPMYEQDKPNQIRILEIYANREAYQAHLKTPHFLYYKENTLSMVKDLRLVEMTAIDPEMMKHIFSKMGGK